MWGYALPPEGPRSLFDELGLEQDSSQLRHQLGDLLDLQALQDLVLKPSLG